MEYAARYVFVQPQPPSLEKLGERLKEQGREEDEVQALLKRAGEAIEYAKQEGVFDKVFTNEELLTACEELEAYIYATEVNGNGAEKETETEAADVPMKDAANGETQE